MNPNSASDDYAPVSADERWIDAALSEHARLGREGHDEELVLRILRETSHRPSRFPVRSRLASDWRGITAGLGAVAALVAAFLVVLSSLTVDPPSRRSEELRFVVRVVEPAVPGDAVSKAATPKPAASRHAGPVEVVPPAAPALGQTPSLATGALELVTEFGPTFATLPRKAVRGETLRITADHVHSAPTEVLYEGEVIVEHARFRIEAENVRVPSPGDPGAPDKTTLQASRVRVVQPATNCIVEAGSLRFEPLSGNLVLTGVTRVETERGELGGFAPGDRLVLSESGFSVETAPVVRYADPAPRSK